MKETEKLRANAVPHVRRFAGERPRSTDTAECESISPEIVLRLDSPNDGCSVFADAVTVHGWLVVTDEELRALRQNADGVQLLIQEDREHSTPLYANMHLAAHVLSEKSPSLGGITLERISLQEIPPDTYGPLRGTTGRPVDIECRLSFAGLEFLDAAPRAFKICFRAGVGNRSSESNRITFSIHPPETWGLARGGISYPAARTAETACLLIEGWAMRPGDALREVRILFDDRPAGLAVFGLRSPNEEKALPFLDESKCCRFAFSVLPEELAPQTPPTVRVSAECLFRSGESLCIAGPQLRWAALDPVAGAAVRGEIEQVRLVAEGLIEVSGWLLEPQLERLRVFLEARTWRVEVDTERTERPDIAARFPSLERSVALGFRFTVHPAVLGATPGGVRVAAESGAGRLELGPKSFWDEITRLIRRTLDSFGSGQRIRATATEIASRLGMRKRFDVVSSPSQMRAATSLERILVASHNMSAVEGAPKVLFQVVRGLLARGYAPANIRVVATQDGELVEHYEQLGVRTLILPGFELSASNWDTYHRTLERLHSAMRELRPQLVFANVIDSFFGADYAFRCALPCLWAIHESIDPLTSFQPRDVRFRQLFLDRLVGSRLSFVAESTRLLFARYARGAEANVTPNGVDLRAIEAEKSGLSRERARATLGVGEELVVSVVGTTTPRKGQDIFLREIAALRKSGLERLRCFIIGAREGEFLEELRGLRAELDLESVVELVAETQDVARYYLASDVMVISSREESAPLVSLEAFAYERPLVSTAVFGLGEQLSHEGNALIFNPDEPGALAAALRRVAGDAVLRARIVAGGAATLHARYSLDACIAGYEKALIDTYSSFVRR